MKEKMKWIITYSLVGLLLIGVAGGTVVSALTMNKLSETQVKLSDAQTKIEEMYTIATKPTEDQSEDNKEDDVTIATFYTIRSTLPISDAYKSGDTSALSDKEKETLDMAKAVLDEIIKDSMTDYEKELAVYCWMTSTLKNDTGLLVVIPTSTSDCDNPYGVLKYHNAVCVGYATTFRMFMQMMDIECKVVHSSEFVHSWDLIKLDGDWYHTDIYSDMEAGDYRNFNMNDITCGASHSWNTDFFPAATGTKYNYGAQHNTKIADVYGIPALVKEAYDNNTPSVFFTFESEITEYDAQIAENLMSSVNEVLSTYNTEAYSWMSWNWTKLDTDYMFSVYLGNNTTETTEPLSDDTLTKIHDTLESVFPDYYFFNNDDPIYEDLGGGEEYYNGEAKG